MFILYNILQVLFLVLFFPLIFIFVLSKKKLRNRIPHRLGIDLQKQFVTTTDRKKTTFWLHALSVGEVTSAIPLLTGLRKKYPESQIVLSVTTETGKAVAEKLLSTSVDQIIDGPIDLLPVIFLYYKKIQPDIFIQVETDFWPNILWFLEKMHIPTMLVNGRMSKQSMTNYSRLSLFFKPMFQSFSLLCLQTEQDKENMITLGIVPEKLFTPGNLKFDTPSRQSSNTMTQTCVHILPKNKTVFIAGSTHNGEEAILITAYANLRKIYKNLFLVLVPRKPDRAEEIEVLAENSGMTTARRSANRRCHADILLVDTIGELTLFYSLADIAFVGGSLVEAGGHNPIEPAAVGLPVMFGPNMQDFSEIAAALIRSGGAVEISDRHSLQKVLENLLKSDDYQARLGKAAFHFVQSQRGVVASHLDLIQNLL